MRFRGLKHTFLTIFLVKTRPCKAYRENFVNNANNIKIAGIYRIFIEQHENLIFVSF